MKAAERQVGSLKFTHHFGWNCFFTLGEQLILQLSVTHSINPSHERSRPFQVLLPLPRETSFAERPVLSEASALLEARPY